MLKVGISKFIYGSCVVLGGRSVNSIVRLKEQVTGTFEWVVKTVKTFFVRDVNRINAFFFGLDLTKE